LDEQALRRELADAGTATPWRRIDVVTETTSTNADLLARAAAGADVGGAVLLAEHQTAGRGRNGRSWSAAPHAQVILSVGVDSARVPTSGWGWLPLCAGIAVVDAVLAVTGVRTGVKWPNDVLARLDGPPRKLAGILSEVAAPHQVIVLGIGLNVTLSAEEAGDAGAVSLRDLGASTVDRTALVSRLLAELGDRIGQWRDGSPLADDYRQRSLTIGRRVRAILPGGGEVTGIAVDVDDQGRLLIDAGQETVTVSAGDVVHLRTA
jgi:BirA family biotin operon repressor/biotin-[acetyl-CoA-carboxylase] ligase